MEENIKEIISGSGKELDGRPPRIILSNGINILKDYPDKIEDPNNISGYDIPENIKITSYPLHGVPEEDPYIVLTVMKIERFKENSEEIEKLKKLIIPGETELEIEAASKIYVKTDKIRTQLETNKKKEYKGNVGQIRGAKEEWLPYKDEEIPIGNRKIS